MSQSEVEKGVMKRKAVETIDSSCTFPRVSTRMSEPCPRRAVWEIGGRRPLSRRIVVQIRLSVRVCVCAHARARVRARVFATRAESLDQQREERNRRSFDA